MRKNRKIINTQLHNAASDAYYMVLENAISNGADVNSLSDMSETPLMAVCSSRTGEPEKCAKKLLESGADPNLRGVCNQTALMYAATNNNPRLISILAQHGANMNASDKFGYTALHHAAIKDCIDAIKTLIDNGIDHSATDVDFLSASERANVATSQLIRSYIEQKKLKSSTRKSAQEPTVAGL